MTQPRSRGYVVGWVFISFLIALGAAVVFNLTVGQALAVYFALAVCSPAFNFLERGTP